MKRMFRWTGIGWSLLPLAWWSYAAEPEQQAAVEAAKQFEQVIVRPPEDSCTWLQAEYKKQLRENARIAQERAAFEAATTATAAEKQECKKLLGTAKLHCQIGNDPHLGPVGTASKEKSVEEKTVLVTVSDAYGNLYQVVVPVGTPKTSAEHIKELDEKIDYAQKALYADSQEHDDHMDARTRVTDLTKRQANLLRYIDQLRDEKAAIEKQLEPQKPEVEASKGWTRPADYDCVRRPGRFGGPVCCPPAP